MTAVNTSLPAVNCLLTTENRALPMVNKALLTAKASLLTVNKSLSGINGSLRIVNTALPTDKAPLSASFYSPGLVVCLCLAVNELYDSQITTENSPSTLQMTTNVDSGLTITWLSLFSLCALWVILCALCGESIKN